MARTCLDCPTAIDRPHAKYCDGCRWRHRGKPRLYVWTPERDQVLRDRYTSRQRKCGDLLGRAWGIPGYAVRRHAAQLGLTRPWPKDRRNWTAEELSFLEEHAGVRHANWIAKRLKRSLSSVVIRMKRLHISRVVREGYRMRDLEMCFGMDHRAIGRWIREGKLGAKRAGMNRTPEQGDFWHVTDEDIMQFLREHPTAYRLDRVDQVWFLDLVFAARAGGDQRKIA
jgi:hypothetical protein